MPRVIGPVTAAGNFDVAEASAVGVTAFDGNGNIPASATDVQLAFAALNTLAIGLTTVNSDATLSGTGAAGSPMGVANNAITTAKINNDAVTQDKIANDSVGTDQLRSGAVTEDELDNLVQGKLIPDSGTDGQILGHSGGSPAWEAKTQANWNQTTTTDASYIQNKPTLAMTLSLSGQVLTAGVNGGATDNITLPTGGGGGTDDQTATEVPITAFDGTGNIPTTASNVQLALDAIDGLNIPAAQVQSDWDATSGLGQILNKPTIPTLRTATETMTLLRGDTGSASTDSVVGITRFSTDTEADAATLDTVAITPGNLGHIGVLDGISLSGNVLTITRLGAGGDITITLPSGGSPPAQAHAIYAALAANSTQTAFTAADFTDGTRGATVASGNTITLPTVTGGDQYRRFAIAIPSTRELTSVTANGFLGDILDDMTKQTNPATITLASNTYEVWYSDNALDVDGTELTITTRSD